MTQEHETPGVHERGMQDALGYFNETLPRTLAGEDVPLHPFFDAEIEFINFEPSPFPGTYRGQDGLKQWTIDLFEAFGQARMDAVEVVEEGDLMAVRMRITATGRTSGVPGSFEWGSLLTMRDGLCVQAASDATFERTLERFREKLA